MILHIYHCNLAIIRDYRESQGQNRPEGTGKIPSRPGKADVRFLPRTDTFRDPVLGKLLRMFQSIDLTDGPDAPVRINWKYLEAAFGCSRADISRILETAEGLGLLRTLTIEYDHEQWMKHSREKGCLVVMAGVEKSDLARKLDELHSRFCDTIDAVKRDVTNGGQTLRHVFVVPNGHLAPRAKPVDWQEAHALLETLPPALARRKYKASLNSYGYPKLIQLAINAHKLGYVLRVI